MPPAAAQGGHKDELDSAVATGKVPISKEGAGKVNLESAEGDGKENFDATQGDGKESGSVAVGVRAGAV